MNSSKILVRFSFLKWVLFLGIIPYEKAALTLYKSKELGNYISYALIIITACSVLLRYIKGHITEEKKRLLVNIHFLFIFMFFLYLFNGLLNDNIQISRFISLLCLWFYYVYAILAYNNSKSLVKDISKASILLIVLSIVLYIYNNNNVFYQESFASFSFKGVALNRNGYIEFAMFPVVFYWYCAINGSKMEKIMCCIISVLSAYTIIITKSATSIICVFVFFLMLIFRKLLQKRFTLKAFYITYALIFVFMILLNSNNNWLIQNISMLFGRSATLTGRVSFWPKTLNLILKKPIFGYGIDTNVLLKVGIREEDPHNGILYLLLTSGIVGTVVFLIIIIKLMNKASCILKNDNFTYCIMAFIISWFIRGIAESPFSYTHFMFWVLVIVVFHSHLETRLKNV